MKPLRELVIPHSFKGSEGYALLALRVMVGVAFVIHGLPKIEHATTWMSATRGAGAFAPWLQVIGALVEFLGGIALVIGFASRLATALICVEMSVATFIVEIAGGARFSVGPNPFELPLLYFVVTLAMLLLGPGRFSVDYVLHRARVPHRLHIRLLKRAS